MTSKSCHANQRVAPETALEKTFSLVASLRKIERQSEQICRQTKDIECETEKEIEREE